MSLLLRILCIVACVLAVCAKPHRNLTIQSRIAGVSTDADPGEFPYMAYIKYAKLPLIDAKRFICGASIIGPKWILTAAHCLCIEILDQQLNGILPPGSLVYNLLSSLVCHVVNPLQLSVVVGAIDLDAGGTEMLVWSVIQHPQYDSDKIINDIGLINLISSTTFPSIPLSGVLKFQNEIFTLCGWGLESGTATTPPNTLRTAEIEQMDTDTCAAILTAAVPDAIVNEYNLCTYGNVTGFCPGDSGSPLTAILPLSIGIRTTIVQVGIVSYGIATATSACFNGFPDVYTNVAEFCAFIFQYTGIRCVQ